MKPFQFGESYRTLLPVRASQPPCALLRLPKAHRSAVDRTDVRNVGALPKIPCRSS